MDYAGEVKWLGVENWVNHVLGQFSQYTVDSRNLEPSLRHYRKKFKSSGVRVIGSSKQIAGSK